MKIKAIILAMTLALAAAAGGCAQSNVSKNTSEASSEASVQASPDEAEQATTEVNLPTDEFEPEEVKTQFENYTVCNGFVRPIGYRNNYRVVTLNGRAYIADNGGVRTVAQDGAETLITKTNATSIATDGKTILFATTVRKSTSTEDRNCEIHSINVDGSDEKSLVKCEGGAVPIMIYENKLYYEDNDYPRQQGLYVKELDGGEAKAVADGCIDSLCFGTKLVYIRFKTHFSTYGKLATYDYTTGEETIISEEPLERAFDAQDGKVYVCSSSSGNDTHNSIYCYDPSSGDFRVIPNSKDVFVIFDAVADGKIYGRNEMGLCTFPCEGGEIEPGGDYYNCIKTDNCLMAQDNNLWYVMRNGSFEKTDVASAPSINVLAYYGKLMFILEDDYETVTVKMMDLY